MDRPTAYQVLLAILVASLVIANFFLSSNPKPSPGRDKYQTSTLTSHNLDSTEPENNRSRPYQRVPCTTTKDEKLILGYTTFYGKPFTESRYFSSSLSNCRYRCKWSSDKSDYNRSDAVIFHLYNMGLEAREHGYREFVIGDLPKRYSEDQKWILVGREPSAFYYPQQLKLLNDTFNISMTYQSDSDVSIPYGETIPLTEDEKLKAAKLLARMKIKKKNVVWLASNCVTSSRREDYVNELREYITVDMHGRCLHRSNFSVSKRSLAKEYNFFLAFENSDCDDYVTEKFWHSLKLGMIPIVRGKRVNYTKIAPPNSFIHADEFESPQHLAQTLKVISSNVSLFRKYHQWRSSFKIRDERQEICNLCREVHRPCKKTTLDVYEHFSEDTRCYTFDRNRDRKGEHMKDIEHFVPLSRR